MLKTSFILLGFFQLILPAFSQTDIPGKVKNARFGFSVGSQARRDFKNDKSDSYRYSMFNAGLLFPIYNKISADKGLKGHGMFISPGLELGKADISGLGQSRMLVNAGISAGGYYLVNPRHFFLGTVRAMANEDEFTIDYYVLRYNASLIYAWRTGKRFTLLSGMAYTYNFGDPYLLPVLGGRYQLTPTSNIRAILPLQLTYTNKLSSKWTLSCFMRSQGGLNRFENRRYFSDTTVSVMMLRRRAFSMGAGFTHQTKNNLRLYVTLAILMGQRIQFTEDGERKGEVYFTGTVENTLQLKAGIIWFPWMNRLRNAEKQDIPDDTDEDDFLLGL